MISALESSTVATTCPERETERGTIVQPIPESVRIAELTGAVSASRLNLFHSCRLKFWFRYVAGIVKPIAPALFVGRAVHAVLQAWSIARWRGLAQDALSLHPDFEKGWAESQAEENPSWETPEEEKSSKESAWKLAETYLRETPIPPDEKPVAVEVTAEADLGHHGLPSLVGVIDLVRPGGKIVDFKTTSNTPNPERALHTNAVQLSCYGLLYRESTGEKEGGFELHHLVKLKNPKIAVVQAGPMTEGQETRLYRTIESYVKGLERRDFVPSPGLQCAACEFFGECTKGGGE